MRRLLLAFAITGIAAGWMASGQPIDLPASASTGSIRFAVIGDNGNGKTPQYEVAEQMTQALATFPFEFVIMLGDNMYGSQAPKDFVDKFERPYASLLQRGIPFYAALGNHDKPTNRSYGPFNMKGQRYYTFAREHVRFFVFDTNLMDPPQLDWIDETLAASTDTWKIAYFHHPLYSDGTRHGSNVELRVLLEPRLVKYGIDVVFSGHEHIYQRTPPQKGITYFVEGSSGQLRKGGVRRTALSAAAFADDQTFMLVEIVDAQLTFRTISRTGAVVDSGSIYLSSGT
jgi:3',5'-cyclic AMP phosphodiesterase CpdA